MRESGIYDHWYLEMLQNSGFLITDTNTDDFDEYHGIKIGNIIGPIYILVYGLLFALIILFFENYSLFKNLILNYTK